ncbi:MAG: hypothetical protein HQ556_00575 [Candidatus Marinimicrobia bacterium]|nr:hypothetical protein [Candidatus Neomarinimicrobiota bacterium]
MGIRFKKELHIFLSVWLVAYSILASGHLGHLHIYSRADAGFCTTECHSPNHHDVKPDCNGFPKNITMGVDTQPLLIQPEYLKKHTLEICKERNTQEQIHSPEHSRAPPIS